MRASPCVVVGAAVAALVVMLLPAARADAGSSGLSSAQPGSTGDYGAFVEGLVSNYNRAQEHEARLQSELQTDQARLDADRYVEAKAVATLRALALGVYMNGVDDASTFALFAPDITDAGIAGEEYQAIASDGLAGAIATVRKDEERTQGAEAQLSSALSAASRSARALAQARDSAQTAVQQDLLFAQVQGHLSTLFNSASQQYLAGQQAEEQALAANSTSAPAPTPQPVRTTYDPRPGRYLDPLRGVERLSPSRIDQGVDYTGFGPVYAVGDGVVLTTGNSGWPGGTFVSYRLTDGRASGLVVYVAEDIDPLVAVGQTVTAHSAVGTMYEGPSGIETGWADPSGDGMTMAGDARQFWGSNSTAFGANFSTLLAFLGAPPGLQKNEPPTGSLPPDWPSW